MATIGIIGANGQVGLEVCLFLKVFAQDRVVAISRTEVGSFLLRRLGIECRHGSVGNATEAKSLLSGCDLVADFSLPKGLASTQRAVIKKNIVNAMSDAEESAKYVFISSTMVFGRDRFGAYRHDWVPRTVYAASKRYGERLAISLGRKFNRDAYILRLGNVYGLLQSISRDLNASLRDQPAYVPNETSDSVFAFTIAEALSNITRYKERPGIYTAISSPPWKWKDLLAYYCADRGFDSPIIEVDSKPESGFGKRLLKATSGSIATMVNQNRQCLTGNILAKFPDWEMMIKLRCLAHNTASDICAFESRSQYTPFHRIGFVPGTRLSSLSDSRETMSPSMQLAKTILRNIGIHLDR